MAKSTIKSILWLLLIMVLFYWKILLTRQFSLLTGSEGVNQGYSWYHFWTAALRRGTLPLWDPYIFAGRSFAGEMQTAAFYPLNFLLTLVPFNREGVFSPQLYHEFFVLAHFLGACFMFALVRELGLSRFSALVAGVCFSLGGFVVRMGWPHMLQSSIWLPVIFLFLLRATKAETMQKALLQASLGGLGLGMAILAGGLHVAMMQAFVIVTAAGFHAFHSYGQPSLPWKGKPWIWAAGVVAVIAVIGSAAGAIQLFPSIEYSRQAFRFLGAPMLPATQKIPYAYLSDGLLPHDLLLLLLPFSFLGNTGAGEVINPYLGVFPLLLATIGIWKNRGNPWVRFMTGLAIAAFLCSLGSFSLLHGLLYALVPFLWMAREAGRFTYLVGFAMAVLAAFGAETLFSPGAQSESWNDLNRILKWVVIGCAVALGVPGLFGRPEINPWNSLSVLMILATFGLFRYIARGHSGRSARFLAMALILSDLNAFDWAARNKDDVARTGTDQLERLLSCRGAATFLKSQPGPFRVQVLADAAPNIGDLFGVQTTGGGGVTMLMNYERLINHVPHATDILNVRYFVKPASTAEAGPVYEDTAWKVYENLGAYPRGWVVHETEVESSPAELFKRLNAPGIDPHRVALLGAPLDVALEPVPSGAPEEVSFQLYEPNQLQLSVRTHSRALLVLSEIFYPGWQASVNGRAARIYEVDGALRGVVVDGGESQVTFRYAPGSILAGAVLTLMAFLGTPLAFAIYWHKNRRREL